MWLPLQYTYHKKKSYADIKSGAYDNIRAMVGNSQQNAVDAPWLTMKAAASTPSPGGGKDLVALDNFAATCYYFAESLTDLMKAENPDR
jgi:hypothetical protein